MNTHCSRSGLALIASTCLLHTASAQGEDFYDQSVLRTIELTFEQSNYWQQLENNYASETYLAADLTIDAEVLEDVGVRFKGNSSYNSIGSSEKKPFNIDQLLVVIRRAMETSRLRRENQARLAGATRTLCKFRRQRRCLIDKTAHCGPCISLEIAVSP